MAAGYAGARTDGLAIGSLIVGILGLVCSVVCLGVLLGPVAAIMGFMSRQRITASGGALSGGGLAIAGLVLGILAFVISAGWLLLGGVAFVQGLSSAASSSPSP
jgi:hypothetical protein